MFTYQEKSRNFPLQSETPRKTEDPELGNSICFLPSVCPPTSLLCYSSPEHLPKAIPKTGSPSCCQSTTFSPSKFFPKKSTLVLALPAKLNRKVQKHTVKKHGEKCAFLLWSPTGLYVKKEFIIYLHLSIWVL